MPSIAERPSHSPARPKMQGGTASLIAFVLLSASLRGRSGEDGIHGLAFAVKSRIEWAFLHVVNRFRTDAHSGEYGGVQIRDRDRVLDRNEMSLVRSGTVKMTFLHATTEHQHARTLREMAMQSVV